MKYESPTLEIFDFKLSPLSDSNQGGGSGGCVRSEDQDIL